MMNLERAAMRGQLAELQDRKRALELKAEGFCNSIRMTINPALFSLDDMDIPIAAGQMDLLVSTMAEIAGLEGKIQRLERELG